MAERDGPSGRDPRSETMSSCFVDEVDVESIVADADVEVALAQDDELEEHDPPPQHEEVGCAKVVHVPLDPPQHAASCVDASGAADSPLTSFSS